MLTPGTEVTLMQNIMGEMARKRSHFIFDRILSNAQIGRVRHYAPDGQLWVDFPGVGILLQEHNVEQVPLLEE